MTQEAGLDRDAPSIEGSTRRAGGATAGGFFASLFRGILRDLMVLAIVFVVATAISAAVCLYYGIPLGLALIGGFLVVGPVFVIKSGGTFG